MRTVADRIRHAISFEIIGLMIVIPLAAWVFKKPMFDIGVLGFPDVSKVCMLQSFHQWLTAND